MKQNRIKMSCSLTSAICNCSPSQSFYKLLWIKWFLYKKQRQTTSMNIVNNFVIH